MEKVTNYEVRLSVDCQGMLVYRIEPLTIYKPRQEVMLPGGKGQISIQIDEVCVADTDANTVLDLKREIIKLQERIEQQNREIINVSEYKDIAKRDSKMWFEKCDRLQVRVKEVETALRVLVGLLRGDKVESVVNGTD